jgi:hypothetical protein
MHMPRFARHLTCLLTVLLAVAAPAAGQATNDPCGSPSGGFNFWVQYRLCNIARSVPKETHVEAPSSLPGSTALVEKAGHPDIVSLALGLAGAGGKGAAGDTATSMTVSAFAIRSSVSGENPMNPRVYGRLRNWRRLSFTVGRSGAGDDIADGRVFGVKALLIDQRDVSDASNRQRLDDVAAALRPLGDVSGKAYGTALRFVAGELGGAKEPRDVASFGQDQLGLLKYEETLARLSEEQLAALDTLLMEHALAIETARTEIADVIRRIRGAPQLAVTYQAVTRPQGAEDEHHFGVLFDVAMATRLRASVNGAYVRTDSQFVEDANVVRVGGELQFDLQQVATLQKVIERRGRDPLTVSVAGLGEWYPDDRPDISRLQVKLTVPLPGPLAGLKIPISLTFANRTELIDESEMRGNVGFTLDFSKLQNMLGALRR